VRFLNLGATLLAAALLMGATTFAFGQWTRFESPRQDQALFAQARNDLDRASRYQYASHGDIKRFDAARTQLYDFSIRLDEGRYDRHQLDRAISHLEDVVEHNSLSPNDRGMLSDDLRRMRDFKAWRDNHQG
jgi:hypothetical protein